MSRILVWLRRDLRLRDNPALFAAAQEGSVLPLYIFDGRLGAAQHAWVCHALAELRSDGLPVAVREGKPREVIPEVVAEHKIDAVYANRAYDAVGRRDERLCDETFNGSLLIEPWEVANKQGDFFKVFTPFWKSVQIEVGGALPVPNASYIKAPLGRLERPPLAHWEASEAAGHRRLRAFIKGGLRNYAAERNRLDLDSTSRLSPYLANGQLSPQQVWRAVTASGISAEAFLSELGWREFSYHLLFHFPQLERDPFRPEFQRFPWSWKGKQVTAWQEGRTGYPVVDAAMHQLLETGWMHNRARMIVASFLTKDLLVHWRVGAEWFWQHLVDADPASNAASWQWTAGCGADAAPYFRVFNPSTQQEKFDPTGAYVERWAGEPCAPVVDHAAARLEALAAYEAVKK